MAQELRYKDIIHTNGRYWVARVHKFGRVVYEVYRIGVTHSTRCGIIDLRERGLARAIAECNRREALP